MISLNDLLQQLFMTNYQIQEENSVIYGQAKLGNQSLFLLGVKESTFLGAEQALIMAEKLIDLLDKKNKDPILLLVDVAGQQLTMRDEWLGMQQYFAHLLECLECVRKQGNQLISLVYNQAVGGGFIAYGLMADCILALPHAKLAVMWLEGIAKVTKIDLDRLKELSKTLAVFAPGVENFYQLGGLHDIVKLSELEDKITQELHRKDKDDKRALLGQERGGRQLAYPIITQIINL